jgi:hypothetical protein
MNAAARTESAFYDSLLDGKALNMACAFLSQKVYWVL